MRASTLLLAGLTAFCSAQSTTTLFLPGFDSMQILASVAGSDATATTYSLACASDVRPDECGVPPSFTLTQGPSTAQYTYSIEGTYESIGCSLGGTTTAVCVVSATPVETGPSLITTALSGPLLANQFQTVTMTDTLPVQTAAETGSAQTSADGGLGGAGVGGASISQVTLETGSASAALTSVPGYASTTSGPAVVLTKGSSGASSAAAATKTSTAGMSKITGTAGWAVGGAALALAVAGL